MAKLTKKVSLVTGASRGLGNVIANDLAKNKYKVYGGVRENYFSNKINSDIFTPVKLDLTNEDHLTNCIETIVSNEGKLDFIIHNSGILYAGAPDTFTIEEIRYLFEINVFGAIRLTQLALPIMRKNKTGKIVFISSIRGIESHVYRGLYSATKSAIESIAFDWAVSLSKWGIKVSVVEPGPLLTNPFVIDGSYYKKKENPYDSIKDFKLKWQSPTEVSSLILKILSEPNPKFRYQTGKYAKKAISRHINDITGQKWLTQQKKWYEKATKC